MSSPATAPSTVLITGATGMLGSSLVEHFGSNPNTTVLALGRNGRLGSKNENVIEIQADLSDPDSSWVRGLKGYNPEIIIHAAASTNIESCEQNFMQAVLNNTMATERVLNYAVKLESPCKIVYISTDAVYPDNAYPKAETLSPCPRSKYGISKLWGEDVLRFGFEDYLILRTTIVGPKTGQFAEWLLSKAEIDKRVSLFRDVIFTPLCVSDFGPLLSLALNKGLSGVYNFACADEITKLDFGRRLIERLDIPCEIDEISLKDLQLGLQRSYNMALDSSAMIEAIGRVPSAVETVDSLANLMAENKIQ